MILRRERQPSLRSFVCPNRAIVLLVARLTEHANSIDACSSNHPPHCSDLCFDRSCRSVPGLLLKHAACRLPDLVSRHMQDLFTQILNPHAFDSELTLFVTFFLGLPTFIHP